MLEQVAVGIARRWWMFVVRGVAAVLFGLLALVLPGITIRALVVLFGIYALVDGISAIVAAIEEREDRAHRGAHVLEGVLAIVVGVITLAIPGLTALALILLIGIWAIGTGIAEIVAAYRLRKRITNEWLLALSGLLSVLAGVIIVARPGAGAFAIAVVIGVYALLFGFGLIWLGLRLRRVSKALERPDAGPPAAPPSPPA